MQKLRVLELFAGLGACSKALERLNIPHEIVDAVEIDKYAIKSFNAIHGTNFEPQDIITWDKDIEVDLIMHGSPCITEDSLILTKNGYKQYKDLKIGDYVLTKSNTWQKIAKKFDNGIKMTYFLQGMGFENIHCTDNHKFYTRHMYRKGHKSIRCFEQPKFKEAKNITKKDYFGVPVLKEEKEFYTNDLDFWYMIGYYLGDGWLSCSSYDIILACNGIKLEKLKRHLIQEKWKYTYHNNGTCYRLRFSNKNIYDFILKYIGTGSFEKRICGEILNLPKEQLESLIEGYIDSDGCRNSKYIQFSSVNRELIYGISSIINKIYHRPTSISKNIVPPTKVIDGRTVNQHNWYLLRFKKQDNKQDKAFYEDGYIWYPFTKLIKDKEQHVYNMEIENDHSYIIQGCISKNCQDFSLAGKQAGGDEGSGTRSSLMYETLRIVEKLKPRYVVWENVKNLLSKKHKHNFDAYLEKMKELGYTSYYQVLNAKDYGIPQNRERVFTISILGNENYMFPNGDKCENSIKIVGNYMPSGHNASRIVDENGLAPTVKENHGTVAAVLQKFEFPPKQELGLKLKDILDDEVDEKYYLSDTQVNRIKTSTYSSANRRIQVKDYCDTLCARDWKDPKCVEEISLIKNKSLRETLEQNNIEKDISYIDAYNRNIRKDDLSSTITTRVNDSNNTFIATLEENSDFNLRIRKLTPKECWRLMGFDDTDFEKAEKLNSATQLYKQAGNSIVVNVLESIFKNLLNEYIPTYDNWDDLD
jgi:DNA (cytosine-5)-methyltransferase 1